MATLPRHGIRRITQNMSAPIIPEDAPFTAEQRAWLNGFFAGWMGLESVQSQAPAAAKALLSVPEMNGGIPTPPGQDATLATSSVTAERPAEKATRPPAAPTHKAAAAEPSAAAYELAEGEDYPWHDPSMDLDERMKLAEDRPPVDKLMAAMAQLDCGACGYMCDTYAFAIADGEEPDLTLCSPGGRETARMLKKIAKKGFDAAPATAEASAAATPSSSGGGSGGAAAAVADRPKAKAGTKKAPGKAVAPAGVGRNNPLRAKITTIRNLNGEGSQKHTVHAEIALQGKLSYRVGDSLGVYPTNCPELVEDILLALRAHGTEHVVAANGIEAQLRDALRSTANLNDVSDELVELVAETATDADEKDRIRNLLDDDDALEQMDVLELLRAAKSAIVDVKLFSKSLAKLQPRLYSIASSPKAHPGEVHLTIAKVTYMIGDRLRKGVASTMFCERLHPGDKILVYAHQAEGFTIPEDDSAPMIMVGPGTGIAPFRAFLEERGVTKAKGKNWLFFGDQHEATDFLYQDEFEKMQRSGLLTKLSTAFSRDQEEKIYVQHRMLEEGAELYAWLEEGAYFFVCGDAKRMAGDVDKALHTLIAEHGKMSDKEAKAYVAKLRDSNRYVRDVY